MVCVWGESACVPDEWLSLSLSVYISTEDLKIHKVYELPSQQIRSVQNRKISDSWRFHYNFRGWTGPKVAKHTLDFTELQHLPESLATNFEPVTLLLSPDSKKTTSYLYFSPAR